MTVITYDFRLLEIHIMSIFLKNFLTSISQMSLSIW